MEQIREVLLAQFRSNIEGSGRLYGNIG